MSFINYIHTVSPKYNFNQETIGAFLADRYELEEKERRMLMMLYRKSKIDQRQCVLPDFDKEISKTMYRHMSPRLELRMDSYKKHALPLAIEAVEGLNLDLSSITHLITVSCTGFYAPGLDIELIQQCGLNENTSHLSVNFKGCYATFDALEIANGLCKNDSGAQVLVVNVELCSLHFQDEFNWMNATTSMLFGDGCTAMLISNKEKGYKIKRFYHSTITKGMGAMTWNLSSTGFLMGLENEVPDLIQKHISTFVQAALNKNQLEWKDIKAWAIHPGGPEILEKVKTELNLSDHDLNASYNVLRKHGNMSSATIAFVLKEIFMQLDSGMVFSCAFGPGLSMKSLILEK